MKKDILIIIALTLAITSSGCVRRIVAINSEPQGAEVYLDRKLIGQTPCTHEFLYYGGHHLELVKEDHANLSTIVQLKGPVYEYFPLSVFSELLIPWQIIDEHSFNFKLQKGQSKKAIISPITQPQLPLSEPKLEYIEEKIEEED